MFELDFVIFYLVKCNEFFLICNGCKNIFWKYLFNFFFLFLGRYLIVIVESHEKVYSMQYLSFFGVQVDPTNIREQEKEASKDEVFFPRAVRWIKSANESVSFFSYKFFILY